MYRINVVIATMFILWIGLVTCEELTTAPESPGDRCVRLAAGGGSEALVACREALSESPDDPQIGRLAADLEFQAGDPRVSAEIWAGLIQKEGWQAELVRGQAMALWRTGDPESAEPMLHEIVDREPSAGASMDLVRFLLAMDRDFEAAGTASLAAELYPDLCEIEELWGQALASLGEDADAAGHFSRGVHKGCPPYRWTRLGPVPTRLDRPPYRAMLVPGELVSGLGDLDNDHCLRRFELLSPVMSPTVAPEVTDQVITRPARDIQLAGLGLLAVVGAESLTSWEKVLASDDLVVRKLALRRIRQLDDPAFIPLLEHHLESETLPGNRNLTALTLGELLLQGSDPDRGRALLETIPENDPSQPRAPEILMSDED